jgi:PLP dependent protein
MSIAQNVATVRDRISVAARRAGRSPQDITLMAVSKTFPADAIREAYDAGIRVFGENRVQEFVGKHPALIDLLDTGKLPIGSAINAHMIGHLQTNKAAKAAELFTAVDSLDSLRLAQRLHSAAQSLKRTLDVLIEINLGGETAKTGVAPDSAEFEAILHAAPQLPNLRFRGLMIIPPFSDDPQATRPHFRALRELRDRIAARSMPAVSMGVLSMGMSHDFEVAIEEGSTCIRVGTAIFGTRKNP